MGWADHLEDDDSDRMVFLERGHTGDCMICGRTMVPWQEADGTDDPRIDCGGNCLWCQYDSERDFPPEVRCAKPRGWTPPPRPSFRQRLEGVRFMWRIMGDPEAKTGASMVARMWLTVVAFFR
jgi:hypothetical protein